MTRLIIGNLDAESDWGGAAVAVSRPSVEAASGAATLLRVFARDSDVLWTPAPVDSRRIPATDGLSFPQFVSGPVPAAAGGRLAWAETDGLPVWSPSRRGGDHWTDRLWSIAPPSVAVARAANDRAFDLELATALGVTIPGSRMTETLDETIDAIGAVDGPWIVKSTWSAAGRHRVRGEPSDVRDAAVVASLSALLQRGPVRVEAWIIRDLDVGSVGLVHPDGGVEFVGVHAMTVDGRGRFRGARTRPDVPDPVRSVFGETGQALSRWGYRGPFGVDGFRARDGRWFPLGEINARLTFGFVLHGLAHRLGVADLSLVFSKAAPPPGAIPLLEAGIGSPIAAWAESISQT